MEQLILLTADPIHAREFCLRRLGALAERSDAAGKVRMSIHQKTVAYRLATAEEALGYPIPGSAIDLAAALLIDLALHGE